MFGDPNDVQMDSEGNSTWTYRYGKINSLRNIVGETSVNQAVGQSPISVGGYIPTPNVNNERDELTINFDKRGIVKEYTYSTSQE
jgi:hypothetical protein